ncbi:hypothetical protein ACIA8K_04920 [Catenuloplanes sp. NPDC051500]|uniref:hypothetical protein n=1 Tax=Catenuloplanes sp. NPDC051500 TaxID=3363959 RepID=UPI0037BC070A
MIDRENGLDDALHEARWADADAAVAAGRTYVPTTEQIAFVMARARAEGEAEMRYYIAVDRLRTGDPGQRAEGMRAMRDLFRTEDHLRPRIIGMVREEPDLVRMLLEPSALGRFVDACRNAVVSAVLATRVFVCGLAGGRRVGRRGTSPCRPVLYGRVLAISGAFVLLFAVCVASGAVPGSASRVATNLLQGGAALLAGLLCLRAGRRAARPGAHAGYALPWRLLGAGVLLWSAGQMIWTWLVHVRGDLVPYPSLADAGYLPSLILITAALLAFGRTEQRLRITIDGLIIAASLFGISWTFVLRDVVAGDSSSWLVLLVAYPVGDVINATIVLTTIAQSRRCSTPYTLIAAGVGALTLADSGFLYLVQRQSYVNGSLIDLGWIGAFLLIAIAAAHPSAPDLIGMPARHTSIVRMAVPYVALGLSMATAVWQQLTGNAIGGFLFYNGILVLGLISIRQLLLQRETAEQRAKAAEVLCDDLIGRRIRPLWREATEIHTEALTLRGAFEDREAAEIIAARTRALQEKLDRVSSAAADRDQQLAALLTCGLDQVPADPLRHIRASRVGLGRP